MKKYMKFMAVVLVLLSITSVATTQAAFGYTYSHRGEPIYSSVGFSTSSSGIYTVISDGWENLSASEFTSPEDLFLYTETVNNVTRDVIYVVDSRANALYVFDENIRMRPGSQGKITQFEVLPEHFTKAEFDRINTRGTSGSVKFNTTVSWTAFSEAALTPYENRSSNQRWFIRLNNISGVYRAIRPLRDEDGMIIRGQYEDLIYLSDKGNNQIVIVDAKTYGVVQVVSSPTDITFRDKTFAPHKLVTDVTGRMFVISDGIYEGIMQMSYRGEFMSFVGVNYVSLSPWERFWRRFSTEEQLAQMESILNTEFRNLTIDTNGFIYTVSRAVTLTSGARDDGAMIKRINPSGRDVLTRNGYDIPKGDLVTINTGRDTQAIGPSRFSGVAVNDFGVYTAVDEKSGRLFTYDAEGNLLYISAGSGPELGQLRNPVAVRYQNENLLVLDKFSKTIIRYELTDIARVINRAVEHHYSGRLVESAEEWKNVVAENPNYEYAYVGIGKSLLNEGRYQEAMAFFQIGFNRDYYSRAYKLYRDEVIKENFAEAMTVFFVVLVSAVGFTMYKNRYRKKSADSGMGDE